MSSIGFNRPGLSCQRCGEPFSLFAVRPDVRKVEELPEPFPARCPLCGHKATYLRSQIGILSVVDNR